MHTIRNRIHHISSFSSLTPSYFSNIYVAHYSHHNDWSLNHSPLHKYQHALQHHKLRSDPKQLKVVQLFQDLWLHLQDKPQNTFQKGQKEGFYLFGGVGCGKTMLMDQFFDSIPHHTISKQRIHFNAFMLHFHNRMHEMRKIHPKEDVVPYVIDEIAKKAKILCFDEFQVTDIADAMILKRLFEGLFAHQVTLVATSNRPPKDLYENGLNRPLFLPFIDFLNQRCVVHNMDSANDYRLAGNQTEKIYLFPTDGKHSMKELNIQVDQIFNKLIQNEVSEPAYVNYMGRLIHVPEQARGVAKFHFNDLCKQSFAAGDYMHLTGLYHTICVKHIPKMSIQSTGLDVIRRFILLIDELYQHNVKLICSAEVKPEELFEENHMVRKGIKDKSAFGSIDEVFAFDRTISRLNEMRSVEYLQKPHIATHFK